nr:hypothetical protein [Cylindrotheca closterium]
MYQKMVEQDKIDEILDITFEGESMFDPDFQDDVKETHKMLKYPPEFKHVDNPDELIKSILKNQLGLEEKPAQSEIKKIVKRGATRKKGKTIMFGEFVDRMQKLEPEFEKF